MEESTDMGGREGGGGRGRGKDVTMLRIDHSDVYINNERLNEGLSHTIDTLHRSRYQKVMSRDSEINELKQSLLAMRQISNRGTSHLKHPQSAGPPRRSKNNTYNLTKKNTLLNSKTNGSRIHGDNNRSTSRNSTSSRSTLKSVEVTMPHAKMNKNTDKIDEESSGDEGTDSDLSSDDDDDDDDDENSNSSDEDSSDGVKSKNIKNQRNLRPTSKMSRDIPNRHPKNHNNQVKQIDPLTRIMSRLNLDKLPPSWYTEVVPASDIHVSRRTFVENDKTSNFHRRNNFSKKSKCRRTRKLTSNIRPSTTGGDIFRQDASKLLMNRQKSQINLNQQSRPFTSVGVRSLGGGDSGGQGRSRSRPGTSSNHRNGDELERSQSVLFCEQASHSSKTMRQLKEEEKQSAVFNTHSTIDILLEEVREEQKVIDRKVRLFVKSLDEKKKSERLKRLMSESNLIKAASSW